MWSFLVGLVLGIGAKTVYDLFKDEQLPAPIGLNAGRVESLLDETRQAVRDLREELRQAMSSQGSLQEKASRVIGAAAETVGARSGASSQAGGGAGEDGQAAGPDEGLMLTASEPSSGGAPGSEARSGSSDQGTGGAPTSTHGTMQTMS